MDLSVFLATILGEIAVLELGLLLTGWVLLRKSRETCHQLKKQLRAAKAREPRLAAEDFTTTPMRREQPDGARMALEFLQRQAHQSHIRANHSVDSDNSSLAWKLRKHYLKAEGDALAGNAEGSEEYWQCLEDTLEKMLKTLNNEGVGQQETDHLRERVTLLRSRLQHLKEVEKQHKESTAKLNSSQQRVAQLERLLNQENGRTSGNSSGQHNDNVIPLHGSHDDKKMGNSAVHHKSVEAFTRKIRTQRELIDELSSKLRTYELAPSDDSPAIPEKEVIAMKNYIKNLEAELVDAEGVITSLNHRITSFGQSISQPISNKVDEDIRIIGSKSEPQSHQEFDYDQAQQEIDKLNEYINRQKQTIENFSRELSRLRLELLGSASKEEIEEKSENINRLERMLSESETCIGMLEEQINLLRDQLNTFDLSSLEEHTDTGDTNPAISTSQTLSLETEEDLREELESMEALLNTTMKAHADQSLLTKFTMAGLGCKSHYDLGRRVLDCLLELGLEALLNIKADDEVIEVYDRKRITIDERKQLKRINPLNSERITSVPAGLVICYPNISCLLKTNGIDNQRATEIQDLAAAMLPLAGALIEKLCADNVIGRQKKTLDQLVQTTHRTIKDIDVQYSYQTSEATQTIDRFMKDVYMAIRSMNLRNEDQEIFMSMINECQERMALLFATGLTIDNTMKGLLDALEKRQ